jgi:hypothetical protein
MLNLAKQYPVLSRTLTLTLFLIAGGGVIPVHAEMSKSIPAGLSQQVSQFRQQGAQGLNTFLHLHANQLNSQSPTSLPPAALRTALDSLCQQRDCYASRLYWYTDLEQAKVAARASGKPILSLRLLGKLDQELSCANSRFFRVALYPNTEISNRLRERFVLHWQSVRPVPTATIDFGDGRKLVRTLTGNSIHYVLNSEGRPIDAIPGLYGPQAFLRQLTQAEQAVRIYNQRPQTERETFLRQYHRDRLVALQTRWTGDLKQLGVTTLPTLAPLPPIEQSPTAMDASRIAVTKALVETPLLSAFQLAAQNQRLLADKTDQTTWSQLAERYAADAKLDRNSLALMQAKQSSTTIPAGKTTDKTFLATARAFEAAMALDTVRNEFLLHSQIHQWFMAGSGVDDVTGLNDRVYAELFLTPGSDPWLGLFPDQGYSAIEQNGIRY